MQTAFVIPSIPGARAFEMIDSNLERCVLWAMHGKKSSAMFVMGISNRSVSRKPTAVCPRIALMPKTFTTLSHHVESSLSEVE